MQQDTTPPQLLTASQLAAAIGVKRRTIDDLVRSGALPEPIKLSPKTVRWPSGVVAQLIADAGTKK